MHRITALITRSHRSLALVAALATTGLATSSLAADPPERVAPPVRTPAATTLPGPCKDAMEVCLNRALEQIALLGAKCRWNPTHTQCTPTPRPNEVALTNAQLDEVRKGMQLIYQTLPEVFPKH